LFNRAKKILKTSEYAEVKRVTSGRKLFAILAYLFVFSVGINIGKNITEREYSIRQTVGGEMADAVTANETETDAKERFQKQISMEVERRIRNQIEEQVKLEMDSAKIPSGLDDDAETKPLAALPEFVTEKPKKKNLRVPASKKFKRTPDSIPVNSFISDSDLKKLSTFSIEHSRHLDKSESEEALNSLKSKGLKAFRRKVTSDDGEVTYRIYSGRFQTKDEAKEYQTAVLGQKGLLDLGKLRKLEPIKKKPKLE
jgi:hypothetical protein